MTPLAQLETNLPEALGLALDRAAPQLRNTPMRMLDLGVFPWDGVIDLSFLSVQKANENPGLVTMHEVASWDYFSVIAGVLHLPWPEIEPLGEAMYAHYNTALEQAPSSKPQNAIYASCAKAIRSPRVFQALESYTRAPDFTITLVDPDNPARHF